MISAALLLVSNYFYLYKYISWSALISKPGEIILWRPPGYIEYVANTS